MQAVEHAARHPIVLLVGASAWQQTLVFAQRLQREGVLCVVVDWGGHACNASFVHRWRTGAQTPAELRNELIRWRNDPQLRIVLPMAEDLIPLCHEVFSGTGLLMNEACPVAPDTLLSKSLMIEQARQAGLIVPRSEIVQTLQQALEMALAWGYPVMLKGDGGSGGSQVFRCTDAQDLTRAFATLSGISTISLQEWVDGNPWAAGGYFEAGKLLRVHVYQKLLLAGSNPTAPPERIRHETLPQAIDDLCRIGRHLRWEGYGQLDFVRRPTGELVFLEFNPRPWGSITAANAGGGDMLGALASRANGQSVALDLENNDEWTGLVYPKPLHRLAREGRFFEVLRLLLSREFQQSRPLQAWSRELENSFLKEAYWAWKWARKNHPS
jgi:hypothetical protein